LAGIDPDTSDQITVTVTLDLAYHGNGGFKRSLALGAPVKTTTVSAQFVFANVDNDNNGVVTDEMQTDVEIEGETFSLFESSGVKTVVGFVTLVVLSIAMLV